MSTVLRPTQVAGAREYPDEVRAVGLEVLIYRLVATHASSRIGYWAAFSDERGVSHYAFTTDPADDPIAAYAEAHGAKVVTGTASLVDGGASITRT